MIDWTGQEYAEGEKKHTLLLYLVRPSPDVCSSNNATQTIDYKCAKPLGPAHDEHKWLRVFLGSILQPTHQVGVPSMDAKTAKNILRAYVEVLPKAQPASWYDSGKAYKMCQKWTSLNYSGRKWPLTLSARCHCNSLAHDIGNVWTMEIHKLVFRIIRYAKTWSVGGLLVTNTSSPCRTCWTGPQVQHATLANISNSMFGSKTWCAVRLCITN